MDTGNAFRVMASLCEVVIFTVMASLCEVVILGSDSVTAGGARSRNCISRPFKEQ